MLNKPWKLKALFVEIEKRMYILNLGENKHGEKSGQQ